MGVKVIGKLKPNERVTNCYDCNSIIVFSDNDIKYKKTCSAFHYGSILQVDLYIICPKCGRKLKLVN